MTDQNHDFLQQAFRDHRVAHICVHNQKCFIKHQSPYGSQDRETMTVFGGALADFTTILSPSVLTLNVQFDIKTYNKLSHYKAARAIPKIDYHDYNPETVLAYNAYQFIVGGMKNPSARNNKPIDLINPSYRGQHVLIGIYPNAFFDKQGKRAAEFLRKNKRDVVMISGLFSTACAQDTVVGALQENFIVYTVDDMILTHPGIVRQGRKHDEIMANYPSDIRHVSSKTVLQFVQPS